MALDRPTILGAALEIIDSDGIEGFNLRALGERLGVSQMAAYRYFKNKAEILDALADELLAQVRFERPDEIADPDALIIGYTMRAREVLLQHGPLVRVIAARPLLRDSRADDLIRLHSTFQAAGFPDELIVDAVLTLLSVTVGLILYEYERQAFDRQQGPSYQQDRLKLLQTLTARPDAPAVSKRLLAEISQGTWGERVFESTIRDCYEGLKRRSASSSAAG